MAATSPAGADAWLHAPVVARRPRGWMHGQVVQVRRQQLVIVPGLDAPTMTCRAASCTRVDPVLSLLLSGTVLPSTLSLADVKATHATVMARLLGDDTVRASRHIPTLLKGVVADEDMPYDTSPRVWVASGDRQQHRFKLQHAIDYVFVNESSAKRISRAVRDSVGEHFYLPPPRDPPKKRSPPAMTPADSEAPSDDDTEMIAAKRARSPSIDGTCEPIRKSRTLR